MTQNQKEWTINGALLGGILLFVVLITVQKVKESATEVELPRAKVGKESSTTKTLPAAKGRGAVPGLGAETTYNADAIPRPSALTVSSSEYPNLGKIDIFRPLVTPLPETPTPTATPAPTPSLERAVASWQLQYRRRGFRGKPNLWVFKDKNRENAVIEVPEGKPFTVNDGAVGDFEIVATQSGRGMVVTIQYKDQQKIFGLR